jgi:hypothetical protein
MVDLDPAREAHIREVTKLLTTALDTLDPRAVCVFAVAVARHVPEPYFTTLVADLRGRITMLEKRNGA